MQEVIVNIINQFGYAGIFLLVVVENLFPPIPSEFILIFSGVSSTYTKLACNNIIIWATLGSLVGAYILYGVGYILNVERLKKILNSKIGRRLHLKEEDVLKADNYFINRGNRAVLFCRFVPIVRSLISIPAGMSKMSIIKFSIYTLIGTIIWNTILVYLGSLVGNNWSIVVEFFSNYATIVRTILFIVIIYLIFKLLIRKKNVYK